ncbi:MAG: ribonuclease P protein component [Clostridia bacterium]|nr:ribonuclease P protein component [Clostridia bacterium]
MNGTIKENRDFRRAYRRGVCYPSGALVTYVFKRKSGGFRIGVTVGKKLGNAVTRNRARRVIRAAWRAVEPELVCSADIVFVARGRTPACKSTEIARVLQGQMRAAGLLREGGKV